MGAGAAGICVLTWFVGLGWYDIRERRLPNWLTMPGATAILAVAAAAGHGMPALLGGLALFAVYLVVHLLAGLGAGDVKLAVGLGALTGAFGIEAWVLAALGAPLLTAGWACLAIVRRQRTVPHGPSMCLAAAAATALSILG